MSLNFFFPTSWCEPRSEFSIIYLRTHSFFFCTWHEIMMDLNLSSDPFFFSVCTWSHLVEIMMGLPVFGWWALALTCWFSFHPTLHIVNWSKVCFFFFMGLWCLLVSFLLGKIPSASHFLIDSLLCQILVFHWKLRMTRVTSWLQFKSMWEMTRVTIWLQFKFMREMARARIKLQFNLCKNSQSENLIAIQSMCNTIDLGLCLKPLTREFCGSGVQSSRDWRTKWRGCKVQSTLRHRSSVLNNWP